jgi:hypothetical protein
MCRKEAEEVGTGRQGRDMVHRWVDEWVGEWTVRKQANGKVVPVLN